VKAQLAPDTAAMAPHPTSMRPMPWPGPPRRPAQGQDQEGDGKPARPSLCRLLASARSTVRFRLSAGRELSFMFVASWRFIMKITQWGGRPARQPIWRPGTAAPPNEKKSLSPVDLRMHPASLSLIEETACPERPLLFGPCLRFRLQTPGRSSGSRINLMPAPSHPLRRNSGLVQVRPRSQRRDRDGSNRLPH